MCIAASQHHFSAVRLHFSRLSSINFHQAPGQVLNEMDLMRKKIVLLDDGQ